MFYYKNVNSNGDVIGICRSLTAIHLDSFYQINEEELTELIQRFGDPDTPSEINGEELINLILFGGDADET